MKSLTVSVTAAFAILFANGLAYAQEGSQDFDLQKLSSRSRAEVRAELEQARTHGGFDSRGESYGSFSRSEIVSTRPRAEVMAELDAARRAKALDTRNYAGVYGGFVQGKNKSIKSREEVLAELASAQAAGFHPSRGERSVR